MGNCVIQPDQFNFLSHGSGGYKFLTNRKKNGGGVSNLWRIADPLPNQPLLAENMAKCSFAWLSEALPILKYGGRQLLASYLKLVLIYHYILFYYILIITFGQLK